MQSGHYARSAWICVKKRVSLHCRAVAESLCQKGLYEPHTFYTFSLPPGEGWKHSENFSSAVHPTTSAVGRQAQGHAGEHSSYVLVNGLSDWQATVLHQGYTGGRSAAIDQFSKQAVTWMLESAFLHTGQQAILLLLSSIHRGDLLNNYVNL